MTIEPQYTVPLVYQLADPSDTGTYFVRAVIRNSLTGATIQTVSLVQGSNGRFTSSFQAPKDPTGQGFHIDVTIQAYTDAQFTTLASGYQRETRTYIVRKAQQSWGSGGADIDYAHMAEIFARVLQANEKDEPDDSAEVAKIDSIIEAVGSLRQLVVSYEEAEDTEVEPVDLTPVLAAIEGIKSHISQTVEDNKPEEAEEVDFSPVLSAIEGSRSEIAQLGETLTNSLSVVETKIDEEAKALSALKQLKTIMKGVQDIVGEPEEPQEQQDEPVTTPVIDDFMKRNP